MVDQGAQAIAITLEENQTLCVIYLEGNNIGDDGTQAFASALKKNQTLPERFNVGVNGIGAAGHKYGFGTRNELYTYPYLSWMLSNRSWSYFFTIY